MKKQAATISGAVAAIVAGALMTLLFLSRTETFLQAILIAYCYAGSISLAIWLVHHMVAAKLSVFPELQQWVLKAFVYTIAITAAYLAGLVFQTLLLTPVTQLKAMVFENAWQGLVYLFTLPFEREPRDTLLSGEIRGMLGTFFAMIFLIGLGSVVGSLIELRWQQSRQKQALAEAELTALRAQIEPHFLFNSLNTIASLIRSDPPLAERLLIQLSSILRYIFQNSAQHTVELRREMEFTRDYLELVQARFGDRLKIIWDLSPVDDSRPVPVLMLQPIVENAIRHGWPGSDAPLELRIAVESRDGHIQLAVVDDGAGIQPDRLARLPIQGHALDNVACRLARLYRRQDLMKITSSPGTGTRVEITIPREKR